MLIVNSISCDNTDIIGDSVGKKCAALGEYVSYFIFTLKYLHIIYLLSIIINSV